jgi:hypothetical protein
VHRGRALIVCGTAASALLLPLALAPAAHGVRPRPGAVVTSPPLLNWRSVSSADRYNVQLWRDGRKILSRFPVRSRLQLDSRWSYRGRDYRLSPATYRWYVWPWLGRRYGRLRVNSSFIMVRPPRNVSPPTVSGEAREGKLLTADRGAWRGTRPMQFRYAWQRCDAAGCVTIPGASGATYRVGAGAIDQRVRVVVTATNLALSRSAASTQTAVVLAAPPLNTARPEIRGSFQQGRTLLGLVGAWQSSRPVAYTFRWLRCNARGGACVSILGVDGQTYTARRADFERRLRLHVMASNSGGEAAARSRATPRIGRLYEGTSGNDLLVGSRGADVLRGRGGADALYGGSSPDRIRGGGGNDRLVGGRGADLLLARDNAWDAINCGTGRDTVVADRGDQVSRNCERVRRG